MTGLGCILGGFTHGIGKQYPFRGIAHGSVKLDVIERELRALNLPGLQFRRVSAPDRNGKPAVGIYVEITDYDEWRPTELSFYLMKLACRLEPKNPFATATNKESSFFLRLMGSEALFKALQRDGAKTDVGAFMKDWDAHNEIYQQQTRRYWLYQ